MLLLATFLTTHFAEWRQSWPGSLAHVGDSAVDPLRWENEGVIAAFEPDTGKCLWSRVFDTPAGFALSDDHIYVNSMYGNRVSVLSPSLETVGVIAGWYMNDLHSLTLTDHGLLITSCGLDGVIELSPSGSELWTWFAADRAYPADQPGSHRKVGKGQDYRQVAVPTDQQVTHCNSAVAWHLNQKDLLLVTLFHQGEVIAVDRQTREHEVILTGMTNPHSLRKHDKGWLVSDSDNDAVVLLGDDFWIDSIVTGGFNWVQDAFISDSCLLVADSNHNRFVWWDIDKNRQLAEIKYSDQWKIYQVEAIGGVWEQRLRALTPPSDHGIAGPAQAGRVQPGGPSHA